MPTVTAAVSTVETASRRAMATVASPAARYHASLRWLCTSCASATECVYVGVFLVIRSRICPKLRERISITDANGLMPRVWLANVIDVTVHESIEAH
jgi:hypothetical protein